MEVVYRRCCGLDIHKRTVVACLLLLDETGGRKQRKREFGTFSSDLRELMLWLFANKITHVAMESTGVYWKPVWNVLEGKFTILLVNPQHMKALPGRKTDQKDSEWIADLLQHGLLRPSFIPPREIRELRDLTRLRVHLKQEVNRVRNRVHRVLEDANIKLSSVISDLFGVSGRLMHAARCAARRKSWSVRCRTAWLSIIGSCWMNCCRSWRSWRHALRGSKPRSSGGSVLTPL